MFDQDFDSEDEEKLNDLITVQMRNKQGDCRLKSNKMCVNVLEDAQRVSLKDIVQGVCYSKPYVAMSIVIQKGDFKQDDLQPNYKLFGQETADKGVTLASCFAGSESREVLGGADQWYCRKCKEHRDITKKIELYKVPKIMIIQLKRFTSKK